MRTNSAPYLTRRRKIIALTAQRFPFLDRRALLIRERKVSFVGLAFVGRVVASAINQKRKLRKGMKISEEKEYS